MRILRVFLDGKERRVPPGSEVRHLLAEGELDLVSRGELAVTDEHGSTLGLEGALWDGAALRRRRGVAPH